jgi:hypothetical protein
MGWATLEASANRVAFARLGSVSVVAGAASGRGFLKMNSEVILGREVIVIDYMLEALTADFGNLAYGQTITVGGESYKVEMQPQRIDPGAWCRIPLMKVAAVVIPLAGRTFRTGSGLVLRSGAGRSLQAQPA